MDVAGWLRSLGFEQYAAAFRDNEIDGEVLPKLTAEDLKELGVTIVGHRRKLLAAIQDLSVRAPSRAVIAEPPATGPPDLAERRQLTVMFSDLVGSTALSARLDPEDLREVINAYHRCCATLVGRHGGYVAKFMGDGILAYFGYPQAHEHDAERAVQTGLAIVDAASKLETAACAPLHVRIGIATGIVVVGELLGFGEGQERGIAGDTPNLAARLQGIAQPNSVVIADGTRRLLGSLFELADLGAQELKGIAAPVRAWIALRANSLESRFEALHASGLTALVGREEECELLLRRWSRARSGEGQVVLLSGEAGIGKSRLTAALLQRLASEPHTRLRYFCSPQHTDSALSPIIGQMERAAGLAYDDKPQAKLDKLDAVLAQTSTSTQDAALFAQMLSLPTDGRYPALKLDPQQRRQRTLEALTAQLTVLANQQPVLMVFEDMHWIDPTSLEVLGRIVDRIRTLPVLLIVTFRPEFNVPWVGQSHVSSLMLNRLGERESTAIISHLAGNRGLPADVMAEIVERSDGIPLFVEEMTKAVLEADGNGAARRMVAAIPSPVLAVPASLHASLMARLDRLGPAKEVAQIGAAIGREFSHALLASVMRKPEAEFGSALDRLVQAGLMSRQGVPPQATYLFKHALVQEAAHSMLLRGQRQELHARIGKVLEEKFPETVTMQPEILAHHFTQAGLLDTAIAYWRAAGELALGRSANAEAAAHLSRGIDLTRLLPAGYDRDQREFDLILALGTATRATKGHASPESLRVYSRARELLNDRMAIKEQLAVLYGLWSVNVVRAEYLAAKDVAQQSLMLAARQEDAEASAFAHRMMGFTLWATGMFADAVPHLERTVDLFGPGRENITDLRYSQDHGVWALSALALSLWPLGFPQQAVAAAKRSLDRAQEIRHAMTTGFAYIFGLVLNGQFKADQQRDRTLSDEASAYCDEHQLMAYIPMAQFYRGAILARYGDCLQGIELMREGIIAKEKIYFKSCSSLHLGHLASAHAAMGQADLALDLLNQAIQMAEETHERFYEAELYRLRGELLISQGKEPQGVADLEKALAVSGAQQARMWELRAAAELAGHWAERGKRTEAHELLASVYGWFTEGLDTPDLKNANALLEELA